MELFQPSIPNAGRVRPVSEVPPGAYPLLRRLTFFDDVGDGDLAVVAELMRPVSYSAGEFIYRQGTPTDGMYVIEEGSVQMWTKVADSRHDLPRLGPGNVVCESAIAESRGRHMNAECLAPTRAWMLDLASFETLRLRAHPAAHAMLRSAAGGLTTTLRAAIVHFGAHFDHPATPDVPRVPDPTPSGRTWGSADYALLRVLPALKKWSDEALAALANRTRLLEVPRGFRLLGEGQPRRSIWLVVRGAIEVSTTRQSGRFRHGLRGPGLMIGQEAVVDGRPEIFDCTARETSLLLDLPAAALDELVAIRSPGNF